MREEKERNGTVEDLTLKELARCIEHRAPEGQLTYNEVVWLCQEAIEYGFGAVSVPSAWLPVAEPILRETGVDLVATIGFPYGDMAVEAKITEARCAAYAGATQVMVMGSRGFLASSGMKAHSRVDLNEFVRDCGFPPAAIKFMINTAGVEVGPHDELVAHAIFLNVGFIGTFCVPGECGLPHDPVAAFKVAMDGLPKIVVWDAHLDGNVRTLDGAELCYGIARSFLRSGARQLSTVNGLTIMRVAKEWGVK